MESIIKEALLNSIPKSTGRGGGGCINEGEIYNTDDGKHFIKRNSKSMSMMKIALVGDSELAILKELKEELEQKYEVQLFLSFRSGMNLMEVGNQLRKLLDAHGPVDLVFIFGLTSSIWRKLSLGPTDDRINVITWNPACNLSFVSVQMHAIVSMAVRRNPAVEVCLVIPTIKDIASFNEAFLRKRRREDLIPSLEEHHLLNRKFLAKKAREVYALTLDLMGDETPWIKKRTFFMKVIFDNFYNSITKENPHYQYWLGATDRLHAPELCYDGLHYTKKTFELLFELWSTMFFKKRIPETRASSSTTSGTLLLTEATSSVHLEEVDAVPGPSRIWQRLEYPVDKERSSRPDTSRPETQKIKGQSKTRGFFSKNYKDSGAEPGSKRMTGFQKLLVLGDEEVEGIFEVQRQLENHYHLEININSQSWRTLSDCDVQLQQLMTYDTNIVWLWALTAYAWKKTVISKGNDKITVMEPNSEYDLAEIVQTIDRLVLIAKQINPECHVFLIIPTIKNMYQYNQTRLRKRWGARYIHYLKHHATLNPVEMQIHTIKSFHEFSSLRRKFPLFHWTDKRVWLGQYTLMRELHRSYHRSRGKSAMLKSYMMQKSSSFEISMIPDGFQVDKEFLLGFFRQVRKSFEPSEPRKDETLNTVDQMSDYEINPPKELRLLSDERGDIERNCVWDNTHTQPQLQVEIQGVSNSYRRDFPYDNMTRSLSSDCINLASTSSALTSYEQQLEQTYHGNFQQSRNDLFPNQITFSDSQQPFSGENLNQPPLSLNTNLHDPVDRSRGPMLLVPNLSPSVEVLEAAMRNVYDQLTPVGTDPQIKKNVAEMIYQITLREKNMVPHLC